MSKVLIADDEAAVRDSLGLVCRLDGHSVHFAIDTPTTVMAYAAHRPDLVLLDLVMPGGGGVEVLRYLRSTFGEHLCPVIVVTGYLATLTDDTRESLGAFAIIEKPFTIEGLRTVVRDALAHRDA